MLAGADFDHVIVATGITPRVLTLPVLIAMVMGYIDAITGTKAIGKRGAVMVVPVALALMLPI